MRTAITSGLALTLGIVAVALATACIQQTCTVDDDCKTGQYCIDSACGAGECEVPADCGDAETCFNHQCTPTGANCDGPAAPQFCSPDMNPSSLTYSQEICVGGETGQVAMLFFGTVTCGTCQGLFLVTDSMADDLRGAGYAPLAIFAQSSSYTTSPYEVGEELGSSVQSAFVQDSDSLGIWAGFGANQYDYALVGADGCIAGYWEDVSVSDLSEGTGEAMRSAWTAAMDPAPSE